MTAVTAAERALACSVIALALRDHINCPSVETEAFITGKTEVSLHWFALAEREPLSTVRLSALVARGGVR